MALQWYRGKIEIGFVYAIDIFENLIFKELENCSARMSCWESIVFPNGENNGSFWSLQMHLLEGLGRKMVN